MTSAAEGPNVEGIVETMISRLREMQATGESEIIGREIVAGEGLAGGGTLADDVTLRLAQNVLDNLARAERSVSVSALEERLSGYITEQQQADALAGYLRRADGYRILSLPFSHPGHVTGTVTAPPLVMGRGGTIESVTVGAAETGADLTVTVAGRAFTLRAGQVSMVAEHGGPVTAGGALTLSLQSTGIRGVTVLVRVREEV